MLTMKTDCGVLLEEREGGGVSVSVRACACCFMALTWYVLRWFVGCDVGCPLQWLTGCVLL